MTASSPKPNYESVLIGPAPARPGRAPFAPVVCAPTSGAIAWGCFAKDNKGQQEQVDRQILPCERQSPPVERVPQLGRSRKSAHRRFASNAGNERVTNEFR